MRKRVGGGHMAYDRGIELSDGIWRTPGEYVFVSGLSDSGDGGSRSEVVSVSIYCVISTARDVCCER